MNRLKKIKELSDKYRITTKTLRYYEKMGIIQSHRTNDYAYRTYDGGAIKRLEQILILRRLNISIKDIKRIFDTSGSEIILEVLGKKADDIDEEVALLHELKEMVLKFIAQIKQADFSSDADVKMLYEKANEIEEQINSADNNAVDLSRLVEVSDKLFEKAEERLDDELLKTIQSFFENNLNVSKTAEILFIHRNTMVWRLEEIEKRTGLDLQNFGAYIAKPIAKIIAALSDSDGNLCRTFVESDSTE